MSRTRKTYTDEFKREAVALVEKVGNRAQVSRDLGVDLSLLKKWQQKLKTNPDRPFPGKGNPQDEELYRLKRENARLKEELEILKKAVGIFSNRPQ
jgi:transposase